MDIPRGILYEAKNVCAKNIEWHKLADLRKCHLFYIANGRTVNVVLFENLGQTFRHFDTNVQRRTDVQTDGRPYE